MAQEQEPTDSHQIHLSKEPDMFELPEYTVLARQMNTTLKGKTVVDGLLGNSPHKFVWYNRTHEEFAWLTREKSVGEARVQGRWLSLPLLPGYVLLLGECGGKILYHAAGSKLPAKYHLYLGFEDGSFLTAMTTMWGAMELYEAGKEQERAYVRGMRPTPVEPEFTFDYFSGLIDELAEGKKQSVKGLLTLEQSIPGLGNAIAQDIMFNARLHPRHPIAELGLQQRHVLYEAVVNTVEEVTRLGGRYDEFDLFGRPGGYVRLLDKSAQGRPCPQCGCPIEKISYLGGSSYFCPRCQV
jgi:formamidopyrimidine-DNA glycosylase